MSESVLENMLARIRVESETKTSVEITAYEALVIDAKIFELKQLVADQRRLIDFLRNEKIKERSAVIAWLQRLAENARHWSDKEKDRAQIFDRLVDVIESAEHRRERDE